MGQLIPGPGRTLKGIFMEKIPGTERHLISEELIAYLSWIIYVAAFKNSTGLVHEVFYNTKVTYLKAVGPLWRLELFIQVEAWYQQYQPRPSKKRRRSFAGAVVEVVAEFVLTFKVVDADNFVDPLQPRPPGMGPEAAAAAAALAAAAASPGAASLAAARQRGGAGAGGEGAAAARPSRQGRWLGFEK